MLDGENDAGKGAKEENPLENSIDSDLDGPRAAALFLSMRLAEAEDGMTPEETLGASYLMALLADSM